MTLFNLDGPLDREEVGSLGRILEQTGMPGCLDPIRQRGLPVPAARPGERSPLPGRPLSQEVDLVRRRLCRAGLVPDDDEAFALLMPRQPLRATAVLAFALADIAGRAPYLVARASAEGGPVRLIDTGTLLEWLRDAGGE